MDILHFLSLLFNYLSSMYFNSNRMQYSIQTTWNNQSINHEPVKFEFSFNDEKSLKIDVSAPFFNSPAKPNYKPGDDFNLWDYEVAEVFFLSDSGKYLELEFGPHGHYLVLLLNGTRNAIKKGLPLDYTAKITGDKWTGTAIIPESYFPSKVTKFNAYSIHGEDANRVYKSLFPVSNEEHSYPDFHRLNYFQQLNFKTLLPANWKRDTESEIWKTK